MTTDAIRNAVSDMEENGHDPAQFLLVCWLPTGKIVHYLSPAVADDPMGHIADYRQALMTASGVGVQ